MRSLLELLAVTGVIFVMFAREGKLSELDFLAPFAFMLVVAVYADESGPISRGLKGLRYLGTISYSLYLNQIIVNTLVWQWFPSLRDLFYPQLAVFLLALLVVSHFTYFFIERPLRLKIRNRLAST